jgi:adenylate kinase
MGPPGVGKGTQSRRVAKLYGIPIIATGDMFREVREEDTPLAREVRDHMDKGEYVPDDLTIKMALERLHEPSARKGFVLDGFPRTVRQAEALDEAFKAGGRNICHVVLLNAPYDVVLNRLTGRWICGRCGRVYNESSNPPKIEGKCDACGGDLYRRSDETPEVQRYRLNVYERQTAPVIAYYKAANRLETVDAEKSVDEVTDELRHLLDGVTPG